MAHLTTGISLQVQAATKDIEPSLRDVALLKEAGFKEQIKNSGLYVNSNNAQMLVIKDGVYSVKEAKPSDYDRFIPVPGNPKIMVSGREYSSGPTSVFKLKDAKGKELYLELDHQSPGRDLVSFHVASAKKTGEIVLKSDFGTIEHNEHGIAQILKVNQTPDLERLRMDHGRLERDGKFSADVSSADFIKSLSNYEVRMKEAKLLPANASLPDEIVKNDAALKRLGLKSHAEIADQLELLMRSKGIASSIGEIQIPLNGDKFTISGSGVGPPHRTDRILNDRDFVAYYHLTRESDGQSLNLSEGLVSYIRNGVYRGVEYRFGGLTVRKSTAEYSPEQLAAFLKIQPEPSK